MEGSEQIRGGYGEGGRREGRRLSVANCCEKMNKCLQFL